MNDSIFGLCVSEALPIATEGLSLSLTHNAGLITLHVMHWRPACDVELVKVRAADLLVCAPQERFGMEHGVEYLHRVAIEGAHGELLGGLGRLGLRNAQQAAYQRHEAVQHQSQKNDLGRAKYVSETEREREGN